MVVLKEILSWSQDRPVWQRDALRRLVEKGELSADDIVELAEISKSVHGLAEPRDSKALAERDLPSCGNSQGAVALQSIFHHRGVNALAEDQTLRFGPHLTIVYGDNGAGKTGYIRILKSACRARGREHILGNVVSGALPLKPVVAIKYKVGDDDKEGEWVGQGEDASISRVSVFDTRSASVYLTEKTDVAFRPFGLDLFDKLVQACKAVKVKLEADQRALGQSAIAPLALQAPDGTAVAKLLGNITSLTKPETVRTLATLSETEEARLALLEKSILDLQANDPAKLVQQLRLRATRVRTLAFHVSQVEAALSGQSVQGAFDARTEWRRKAVEGDRLREVTFPVDVLQGTGSEPWKLLWQAARSFSLDQAYVGKAYPVVGDGAQCVLCQQGIEHDAAHRLEQFEAFVASTTERELKDAFTSFDQQLKAFVDLRVQTDVTDETIKEFRIEHEAVADSVAAVLVSLESRRKVVSEALAGDGDLPPDCSAPASVQHEATALADQLDQRVKTLGVGASAEDKKLLTTEAQELRARKFLAKHEASVLIEIERRKKDAAFGLCLNDTRTQSITQKSTALTKAVVTQKLKTSFQDELAKVEFHHVEVELNEVGGAEGILFHKLVLTRAPSAELPKIVSEGEQRCLSIAAFFAELSTADDHSGIVFDDPVSSLDYKWRDGVARRLVEAAKGRQVIVFTHDVVFLLLLKQFAQEQQVEQLDQHIRQLDKGAGVCAEEMPWVALPVRKKIGFLKNGWQAADKLSRDGHKDAYEKEAKYLYGLLREAWERALEEVLLCGVVERYRPGVQTQQVLKIADITEDDCRTLDTAMSKCSRWLPGHDKAAAARAEVPVTAVLKGDIEALEKWMETIQKRRK